MRQRYTFIREFEYRNLDLIETYYVFPALSEVLSVCARSFRLDDTGDGLTKIAE